MRIIFLITFFLGLLYFVCAKRRFDFFTLANFSASIYFLPGVFGFVLNPYTSNIKIKVPIYPETYLVMTLVLFGILISGFLNKTKKTNNIHEIQKKQTITPELSLLIGTLGIIISFITTGQNLLLADKGEMLNYMNRYHLFWQIGASIGGVLAYVTKKRKILILSLVLLLIDVYIGFRSVFAILMLSILTIHFSKKEPIGFYKYINIKMILLIIPFLLFVFVYKYLYIAIKLGEWQVVLEKITDINTYFLAITNSEPFTTQAILNEVIGNNFQTDLSHFKGILYQFILFSPELGAKSTSFNDLFQPVLFPYQRFGLANNIWAEMLSSGGVGLLLIFILVFCLILKIFSNLLFVGNPMIIGISALLGAYWAFYIHRNDLLYQVNLEKNIFLLFLFCFIIDYFLKKTDRTITNMRTSNKIERMNEGQ